MVSYALNKGDHDGFNTLHPKSIFNDLWGDYKTVYDSEFAYYDNKLHTKIKAFFPNATCKQSFTTINANNNVVNDEMVYIDAASNTLIAIKFYWELEDYLVDEDDINAIDPETGYSEDEDEGPKKVKITKTSKFQAKVNVYTNDESDLVKKFVGKIFSQKKTKGKRERQLSIVCFNSTEGLYLKNFKTNQVDISIADNYNDDFSDVSETIIRRLSTKADNGIVLFHSEPGCGKTSYLRHLTQKISNKRMIYLPPEMAHKLADPDFMGFLMSYPNSVLFIEDAENCLQKRDAHGNQAVSNLLNNSDGLLGDALKLQIVCTFNCSLSQIDPALMRPGRLIAEYKFEKLSKDKTTALIKKLYGENSEHLHRVEPMTLAEIYNLNKRKFATAPKTSASIGFNRH